MNKGEGQSFSLALLHRPFDSRPGRAFFSVSHRLFTTHRARPPYAGFGIGVYRYRFPDQQVTVTTGGLRFIVGLDVMTAERFGLTGEVAIHAIDGPRRAPVFSYVLFSTRATFGARVLF